MTRSARSSATMANAAVAPSRPAATQEARRRWAAYARAAVSRSGWLSLLVLGLLLLLVGCSSGGSSATVVRYERDWPDGYHEELTITEDGHVTMKHGDVLERLTLTSAQVQQIRDALAAGVHQGDEGDSLVRTVVLANGTSLSPVKTGRGLGGGHAGDADDQATPSMARRCRALHGLPATHARLSGAP